MASNADTFPTDGNAYQVTHPWNTAWAFINNASGVNVTVSTDQGFKLTVPAGAGLPWALPVPTRNLTVQSASASAGGLVYLTSSDSIAGEQSYASNIVTGTVNANILNSNLNVTASGTVNANVLNSSINANIQNASLAVTDSLVETNTTVLTGVLPANVLNFTLGPGASAVKNQTIAKAIDGFSLAVSGMDGFLTIYYTASGLVQYIRRRMPFNNLMNNAWDSIEGLEESPIPAAAVLTIQVEYATQAMSGVLKW